MRWKCLLFQVTAPYFLICAFVASSSNLDWLLVSSPIGESIRRFPNWGARHHDLSTMLCCCSIISCCVHFLYKTTTFLLDIKFSFPFPALRLQDFLEVFLTFSVTNSSIVIFLRCFVDFWPLNLIFYNCFACKRTCS